MNLMYLIQQHFETELRELRKNRCMRFSIIDRQEIMHAYNRAISRSYIEKASEQEQAALKRGDK